MKQSSVTCNILTQKLFVYMLTSFYVLMYLFLLFVFVWVAFSLNYEANLELDVE